MALLLKVLKLLFKAGMTIFAPDVFFKQLMIVGTIAGFRFVVHHLKGWVYQAWLETLIRSSPRAKEIDELRQKRSQARDYRSFKLVSRDLDRKLGYDAWKKDDRSNLFDAKRLRERTRKYRELMDDGDVEGCLFFLRQELLRKHFGVCNPRLFEKCNTGTKEVIETYVETVCEAMTWAAFEHHERSGEPVRKTTSSGTPTRPVTLEEKLAFFSETKHSFGRCALLLSGGAQLGMYHWGVVKALHQNGLLPRIISGTSAGSIICAVVCSHTDDELMNMYRDDFDWDNNFKFTFFGDVDFHRFLQRRGEALYSSDVLAETLRKNIGDLTFLEAYDLTGRICNITVSGLPGNTQYPMLLNYLTSPHVLIWSASLASAAVPGIFEPRELMAKDRYGKVVPYFPEGLKWRDGSMQNDLPMTRLTELFNVNFFIVSQVNPHAMLITGAGYGRNRGPIYRIAQFLRRELKQYLISISEVSLGTAGTRVSPWLRPVGYSAVGLLVQEYEGDITIYNGRGLREIPHMLENPNPALLQRYTRKSEWQTWEHIPRIENSCKIEFVMDEILKQLRQERVNKKPEPANAGTLIKRMVSKEMGIKRLPSFQQQFIQHEALLESRVGKQSSDGAGTSPGGRNNDEMPIRRQHSSLFASSASLLQLAVSGNQ